MAGDVSPVAMFLFDRPLLTRDWKSESGTDLPTDGLTWVGARDTCVSKKTKGHLSDCSFRMYYKKKYYI